MIFPIRTKGPLIFPLFLYFVLLVMMAVWPAAAAWPSYGTFAALPYILFSLVMILGVFFAQTRIVFLALLLSVTTIGLEHAFFGDPRPTQGEAILFFAGIYIPPLALLFYHLQERGMFSSHGIIRLALVMSAVVAIVAFPMNQWVCDQVTGTDSVMFKPVSNLVSIPAIAVIIAVICWPFFLIRNKHESPHLGSIFVITLLYVFTAFNFRGSGWRTGEEHTVMLLFMSGAAVTLVWAVLESSWRSAHVDELTDLPGRRSLKHRLASLGESYSIAVIDIDFFKKINDRFGHDTGDQVLRFIASHMKKNDKFRAYRYGGEEFVIVTEGTGAYGIQEAMEELRRDIERSRFIVRSKDRPKDRPEKPEPVSGVEEKTIRVTVSIGAASSGPKYNSPQEVLDAADKALYRAKADGRNCLKLAR